MAWTNVSRRAFVAAATGHAASALLPAQGVQRKRLSLCGVALERVTHGAPRRSYVLIHGNETTARDVLSAHMQSAEGKAHLVTGLKRNVTVRGLMLDPNRMFSRQGAERSFTRLNPDAAQSQVRSALNWLDRERPKLVDALLPPPGGLIVALHNNSEGYSLEDEVGVSDSVSLPSRAERHEFMLATAQADFDILSRSPFNVVLQKSVTADDDGSLSRLCTARGIRYVNIEAHLGRAAEQTAMLAWLEQNLP